MNNVVVIGAGQAGAQAAASLRQHGFRGEILVFGDEPHPPYQRPLLSKQYLAASAAESERLFLRADTFYRDHRITLRTDERIDNIDCAARCIRTARGETVDYQDLILATGSRPRKLNIPGSNLPGVHYLRTLNDVDAIKAELLPGKKLVIVGGGYIGLEVASVAVSGGVDVVVVETEERILKRVTNEQMSAFYHQLHEARGVNILLNAKVSGFVDSTGQGRLTQVSCGDTSLDADLAIIGIGIVPNVELAQAAGLTCDNGIVTDEYGKTSVAHVYAAGDCTNHPNALLGRRLRLESVPNAVEQAKVVAANIMGKNQRYAAVPWFWSDQYEHKLQMVGFSADGGQRVQRGDKKTQQFAIFYFDNQRLVAVDAVNSPADFMAGRQFYGRRFDLACLDDLKNSIKDCLTEE